jgi:hypothetical protein
MVYAMLLGCGEHVTIKVVLEFPPKDSWRTLVSLLSRYGTWVDFPSVKAFITLPRAVKLTFIFLASSSSFPYAPVFPTF